MRGTIDWVFDELPPSGARRGGDPSEHAFKHDLETFVREVVQNANDQAVSYAFVRFTLIELEGEALARFQEAAAWPTLESHLRGAARARGGMLGEFLERLDAGRRMLLLRVEDRGTRGLTGDENEDQSHFRALCKDTLYSHKTSESAAGGSYGLGKSVLWSFSGLSTVLFNSILLEEPPRRRSPRLIGRTELPSHAIGGRGGERWFTGSGWLGRRVAVDGRGERAESVWDEEAARLAERLYLERPDGREGTSILIVGFRDPTSEGDDDARTVEGAIRTAVVKYFWPAMVLEQRRLRVEVGADGARIAPEADPAVRPFLDAWEGRHGERDVLEQPGDVATRRIPIDVPDLRDGTAQGRGYVDLIVRLASPSEVGGRPLVGHVAMFRGPGMVVRYWDRASLAAEARPFHAVLACGTARRPGEATEADRMVERFLRAAEPPGHDDWFATPALKQQYRRGYAKALERLKSRINEELRKLVVAGPTQGTKGPERLQRRFPIGARGGRGSEPSAFHFSRLDARFDGERWRFEGEMRPARRGRPWRAVLRLWELGDDGAPVDRLDIERLTIDEADVAHRLQGGVVWLDAPAEVPAARFEGVSAPWNAAAGPPGELSVEITGELGSAAGATG
ncbi:MAG: hypothetical protein ACODAU_13305 [Myxococcota bacterium]